jgi:hypothetical protein
MLHKTPWLESASELQLHKLEKTSEAGYVAIHSALKPLQRFKILLVFSGPPLWSSGQSSWLQIQRSGFDSRRYHVF